MLQGQPLNVDPNSASYLPHQRQQSGAEHQRLPGAAVSKMQSPPHFPYPEGFPAQLMQVKYLFL